jgi:hypothetical protein
MLKSKSILTGKRTSFSNSSKPRGQEYGENNSLATPMVNPRRTNHQVYLDETEKIDYSKDEVKSYLEISKDKENDITTVKIKIYKQNMKKDSCLSTNLGDMTIASFANNANNNTILSSNSINNIKDRNSSNLHHQETILSTLPMKQPLNQKSQENKIIVIAHTNISNGNFQTPNSLNNILPDYESSSIIGTGSIHTSSLATPNYTEINKFPTSEEDIIKYIQSLTYNHPELSPGKENNENYKIKMINNKLKSIKLPLYKSEQKKRKSNELGKINFL